MAGSARVEAHAIAEAHSAAEAQQGTDSLTQSTEQPTVTLTANAAALPEGIGDWNKIAMTIVRPLFKFFWRIDIQGIENLPKQGGALLCPNHLSVFDSFVLPAAVPRQMTFVGKAEYLDDWKTRTLFPKLGMIPIDRRGGKHANAALDAARAVLLSGGVFGIYPEGTRSRSGNLHKGHTGAARLAIETGSPVVPVGILGTVDIQPPDQPVPNVFRRATIKFGTPIDSLRYRSRIGDRVVYRELTDELMFEIQALTGQIYEDTYANKKSIVAETDAKIGAKPVAVEKFEPMESTIERRSSSEAIKSRPLINLG